MGVVFIYARCEIYPIIPPAIDSTIRMRYTYGEIYPNREVNYEYNAGLSFDCKNCWQSES